MECGIAMNEDAIRSRVLDRIRRLPTDRLPAVERFLLRFEPGAIAAPATSEKEWPHAPVHRISEHGTFIVTAGTLHKQHFFLGAERLDLLEGKLLEEAHR